MIRIPKKQKTEIDQLKNKTLSNASSRGIPALLFMVILEGFKTWMASEARNFHSRGMYDLL